LIEDLAELPGLAAKISSAGGRTGLGGQNAAGRIAMPDHGREVKFGYFLVPDAGEPLIAAAQEAERLGLDYVAVQDHPYQRRFVDTWTLLSMIAAATSRIGLFPDVANLPLRPPAVLAKAAASLDVLTGGRVELGLGAGGFWDAIEAFGGARRSPGESLAALGEAIEVIRKVWSGERNLRFDGRYYRLAGAQSGPVPAHPMGIWLGVYGPKALRLAGRAADGWVPSFRGELTPILKMSARLDEGAAAAGRDPAQIRRILNVGGTITDGATQGPLRGPAAQWADELTDLVVAHGFDTFVLWSDGRDQLSRFAGEVIPAVRVQVAAERG
jgi:alkanesulfonate monooxygenase SsuD/methylene tetrahydromethanopterin reductase-like flavin-dependent oxidoreductase (luciferase family)